MDKKLGGYYTMLRDQGKLFAGAPPYPFHAQVREATAPIFYEAIDRRDRRRTRRSTRWRPPPRQELTNLGYRK